MTNQPQLILLLTHLRNFKQTAVMKWAEAIRMPLLSDTMKCTGVMGGMQARKK